MATGPTGEAGCEQTEISGSADQILRQRRLYSRTGGPRRSSSGAERPQKLQIQGIKKMLTTR